MRVINKQVSDTCKCRHCHVGDFTLDPELQEYFDSIPSFTDEDLVDFLEAMRSIHEKDVKSEQETLIEEAKETIEYTQGLIDNFYDSVIVDLKLKDGGEDWVFDYLFNNSEGETFEEYLARHGRLVNDVLEDS
jgi:hypothetical protein